ncbi:Error-prone DNA polymerase [ANME-1 cluster archaeon GoMg1]|nr:Error-prone DNA polymerase [ANME-1 cluster archaeon GoMg1]
MNGVAFDLHIHSSYSFDSFSKPANIVEKAIQRGLKGIAITDHNTIRGGVEAYQYALEKHPDFIVIVGSEINTPSGEILGLFLKEEIKDRDPYNVIAGIKNQGGIVILPHPFKRGNLHSQEDLLSLFDAIEVFNARTFIKDNLKALALAESCNKPITGGSDAHFIHEIGGGLTLIKDSFTNLSELKKAIINEENSVKGITSSAFCEVFSQWIRFIKERNKKIGINNLRRSYRTFGLLLLTTIRKNRSSYWGKFEASRELEELLRNTPESFSQPKSDGLER